MRDPNKTRTDAATNLLEFVRSILRGDNHTLIMHNAEHAADKLAQHAIALATAQYAQHLADATNLPEPNPELDDQIRERARSLAAAKKTH
ncbi:MAG: hypothetical protein ACYTG0_40345 [Planctomycetota bacterium]